jgi:quercetin dioxygenase-like cupin family protein
MPAKGQIITDPTSGDTFEFIETAADTNGERVTVKSTVRSKGQLVPKHFHVFQDETFEVESGHLTVILRDKTMDLPPGEKMTLPSGIPHNHYNGHDEAVVYVHTVEPAMDFDFFLENLVGLAADGKSKNGRFGLVQELVTLRYLDGKSYLADIPIGVQKLLMHTIAPIARLFGYRALYRKYSGIEK